MPPRDPLKARIRRFLTSPATASAAITELTVAPHCDSSILHAPGECQYCDLTPDWQALRDLWRINFTGHYDIDKAPCPSVYFRAIHVRDQWPGNRPDGGEE